MIIKHIKKELTMTDPYWNTLEGLKEEQAWNIATFNSVKASRSSFSKQEYKIIIADLVRRIDAMERLIKEYENNHSG